MKNRKLVILLASLLIFSLVISGCSFQSEQAVADSEPKKQESVEEDGFKDNNNRLIVEVTEAMKDDLKVELDFTGELVPYREVNLVPEISGVVREIKFEENDQVKKGQLLLKLDQAMEKAKVERAEGNLEVAKAQLDKLEAGSRIEEIKQAEAALEQAKAEFNNARKNFERLKNLYEKDVVSKREYDSAKSKYEITKAKVESAQQQLQLAKKGPRQEEIEVAKAQLKQAKASLNSAETQLNKTTIESPIQGVIAQKKIELGEMAATGSPVAKIVQLRPLEFEGSISTDDLTKVKAGQNVTVKVDSYPEKTFTGEISKVASTVDSSNRGLKVTVQMVNKELLLKPGMFASGKISVDELEDVLVVPKAAVKEQNGSKQILVVKNGVIESRDVETGPANNNRIVVNEGLKPGEKAVIRGPANLQSGTEVKVVERGEIE